jgi:hypothetical protein
MNKLNRKKIMAKYGKKAQEKVEKAMHERKHGELKSGSTGKKVKSKKQAIAIGLSEARKEGGKVPEKKASAKKTTARKSSPKKKDKPARPVSRKATAKKPGSKKKVSG